MLGRRHSVRGEPILIDYALEDALNESSDIEWINKVIIISLYDLLPLSLFISLPCFTRCIQ